MKTVNDEYKKDWADWPAFNRPAPTVYVGPLIRLATTVPTRGEGMTKVKLNEDTHISPDGINVIAGKAGETHAVEHLTATTLVAEGKAEFDGNPSVKLKDKIEAGEATANQINPVYGSREHREAVQNEMAEDPKVVADRKKQQKENK